MGWPSEATRISSNHTHHDVKSSGSFPLGRQRSKLSTQKMRVGFFLTSRLPRCPYSKINAGSFGSMKIPMKVLRFSCRRSFSCRNSLITFVRNDNGPMCNFFTSTKSPYSTPQKMKCSSGDSQSLRCNERFSRLECLHCVWTHYSVRAVRVANQPVWRMNSLSIDHR